MRSTCISSSVPVVMFALSVEAGMATQSEDMVAISTPSAGNGTYHGTSTKHMQMYLSEFCYRFNRRSFNGAIFDRLLVAIVG